jgi:ribonuclease R
MNEIKDQIYYAIETHKNINFDDLFKYSLEQKITSSKQELGQYLRILENEQHILQFSGQYYNLHAFEDITGFPQWNMNGFCWLESKDISNDYGITFNPNEKLLSVFNKRNLGYGEEILGKKITLEDREFVYILDSRPGLNKKIIGVIDKNKQRVVSLNSNLNYQFQLNSELNYENDDIVIFNSNDFSVISKIGNKNDKGIEAKIIKLLADIKSAPDSEIKEIALPKLKLNLPFYTIDSIHTSDIDDAIYIKPFNGGFKLYVGIANVSAYVEKDDIQDKHAQMVCSSNYLPLETVHMLSRNLAEVYCSLNVGEKKSSVVCELTFDADKKIIDKKIYEAEIISQARLTYDDVERILQGLNPQESLLYKNNLIQKFSNLDDSKEIIESLNVLKDFANQHKRVNDKSYWVVEMPEYHLGENGKVDYLYYQDENSISQKMVETAMLSANIAVAEFLHENYPGFAMFRNQTKPLETERPKSATYDTENNGHWGLQTEFYTHFTSPIRRYCDLLVHKLIKSIIYKKEKDYNPDELNNFSKTINLQQYISKQCAIKGYNLLTTQYVETLSLNNNVNTDLEIVDYSSTGIVMKNKQLIEFFIPYFKLENYVTRVLDGLIPENKSEITIEMKKAGIELLSSTWNTSMQLAPFSWTDERKNALYQFQRKERNDNLTITAFKNN